MQMKAEVAPSAFADLPLTVRTSVLQTTHVQTGGLTTEPSCMQGRDPYRCSFLSSRLIDQRAKLAQQLRPKYKPIFLTF